MNPTFYKEGNGDWVLETFRKRRSLDFSSYKNGEVAKIGGVVLKKGWRITYFHTNPFQCYSSLSIWCVCVCVCVCECVVFICTSCISIICVSQEEPSLIASNQQICDFYKWIIFKKKKHCGIFGKDIVKSKFLISVNYSLNHLM